ncbi:MAG: OmpA family protein [Bacteroidia bacterium]|nr:OmpA family protein [Bacteroidia bacterium]
MKKPFFNLIIVLAFTGQAYSQANDTLIYAQGKIVNAMTKEAVVGKISYQSLPYGNKVGMLSGSDYKFAMYDKAKYSIIVQAPGFAQVKYMLDPASANPDRVVVQDIELGAPVSAAKVVETAHTAGKEMTLDNLIFELGKAKISPASHSELNSVVKMLEDNPAMVIQLEGHTDTRGDARQNLKLSQQRVEAAKDYLISNGVSKHKVKTKAFGGTMPLSHEDNEAAHKMNRRVVVRILQN